MKVKRPKNLSLCKFCWCRVWVSKYDWFQDLQCKECHYKLPDGTQFEIFTQWDFPRTKYRFGIEIKIVD